jgi:hypothetical protein
MLTEKGHWGHYSLRGPYGKSCNTVDEIDDGPGVSFEGTEMAKFRRKRNQEDKKEDTKE